MKIFEERAYQYLTHLSTGGQGEIHLIQRDSQTFVAKILPALDGDALRLLEEIGSLRIPNIPQIREVFTVGDQTIIIREYIPGNTLRDEILKNGTLTLARSKAILRQICETLRAFHGIRPHPIIYRDLKPENVIVTPEGDVRLIDFGIARHYHPDATRDTVIAGTAGYTAPEVMAGMQSDERSDVYSAGLLFYEMLTGRNITDPPYQIRPVAESGALLPHWVDAFLAKATDINPANRYSGMAEFCDSLENPEKLRKRHTGRRLAAVLAAMLLLGGALYFFGSHPPAKAYEMILSLDFESEADRLWVLGYENPHSNFTFADGRLYLLKEGCNIDFTPKPGMIVHYRISLPQYGSVGLSQFRINPSMTLECLYYHEQENRYDGTGEMAMEGLPFKSTGQWIDAIFYITPDGGAVYVLAADESAGRICYIARQIPDFMQNKRLYMELNNFSAQGNVVLDSVSIAEGSLSGYLADHLHSYADHRERVDAFLDQDRAALPVISF